MLMKSLKSELDLVILFEVISLRLTSALLTLQMIATEMAACELTIGDCTCSTVIIHCLVYKSYLLDRVLCYTFSELVQLHYF